MRRYRIDIGEPIRLGDLDFADDISPLKTFRLRLQTFINSFKDTAEQFGLKINTNKTKSMGTSGFETWHLNQQQEQIFG